MAGKNKLFVKICGITRLEDAMFATANGAGAVGFIAYPKSPRYVTPEQVSRIAGSLKAGIRKVAVFVNPGLDEINAYIAAGADVIQLHGDETAEFAEKIAEFAEVWKALRLKTEDEALNFRKFPASKFLLDAFSEKEYGGTGRKADWNIAKFAVETSSVPIILAGGLNPANIAEAVNSVNPFGVDISSGVESSPGIKDLGKLSKLFEEIKKT